MNKKLKKISFSAISIALAAGMIAAPSANVFADETQTQQISVLNQSVSESEFTDTEIIIRDRLVNYIKSTAVGLFDGRDSFDSNTIRCSAYYRSDETRDVEKIVNWIKQNYSEYLFWGDIDAITYETSKYGVDLYIPVKAEYMTVDETSDKYIDYSKLCAPVYRLYNGNADQYLLTTFQDEVDFLTQIGWTYQDIAFYAARVGDVPVYRLYNPNSGSHFYTAFADEKEMLINLGWVDEGIAWYSVETDYYSGSSIKRFYNSVSGEHVYISYFDYDTQKSLRDTGWTDEGIAFEYKNIDA